MHKIAAVQKRDDLESRRQDIVIQLFDLLVNRRERFVGIRAFAQEDDAFHDVLIIQNHAVGPVNGSANLSKPYFWRLYDAADVSNANGCAVLRFDYRLRDVACT